MADGNLQAIPRKSPASTDQRIASVAQPNIDGGANVVMELVQKKGMEGAVVVHSAPSISNTSATALAANPSRVVAVFYNAGTSTIHLSGDGGSATATDLPLEPGMVWTDQWTTVLWTALGSGTGDDLRVMEIDLP
jgi:hypothetical protein